MQGKWSLTIGVTRDEMREIFFAVAVYCGVPAGVDSFRVAREVFAEIDKKLPSDLPSSDDCREKLAKRQASAAVALLRMNQPEKVWPLVST